jgi:hypothetical protein
MQVHGASITTAVDVETEARDEAVGFDLDLELLRELGDPPVMPVKSQTI